MDFESIAYTNFATPARRLSVWDPDGIGDPSDTLLFGLNRTHNRLFRLNDQIEAIDREARQVGAELDYHRMINDDAQRDAAVGNYIDREEAGLTAGDVRRFERTLARLADKRRRLAAKRDRLLTRLPD